MLLLILMSVLAFACGVMMKPQVSGGLSKNGVLWFMNESSSKERSLASFLIAVPFWIWALIKFITAGDPDLGGISFLLVMISSISVYRSPSRVSIRGLCLSCFVVSLNYLLPLFMMTLPTSFQVYLAIGAIYWLIMAIWNLKARNVSSSGAI